MSVDARQLIVCGKQLVGLRNQVVLLIAINGVARNLQITGILGREVLVHILNLERIGQRNRVEHGLNIVVTILACGYDVESKIYLGAWKCYHATNIIYFPQKWSVISSKICKFASLSIDITRC